MNQDLVLSQLLMSGKSMISATESVGLLMSSELERTTT